MLSFTFLYNYIASYFSHNISGKASNNEDNTQYFHIIFINIFTYVCYALNIFCLIPQLLFSH